MTAYKTLSAEQIALLKQRPSGEMLHLIALVQTAKGQAPDVSSGQGSAYRQLGDRLLAALRQIGARTLCLGSAASHLIGPADERWDFAYLIDCPDAVEFAKAIEALLIDPVAQEGMAGIANARLLHMRPIETW